MSRLWPALFLGFAVLAALPIPGRAQLHPQEITGGQSRELPYRESGRLTVTFGRKQYFGTATYIRRYTALTAGHMIYDPVGGFSTSVYLEPDLWFDPTSRQDAAYTAALSGYQAAANVDPNSAGAFAQDLGYVLFLSTPMAEWASFSDDPTLLTTTGDVLALGYAADSFAGDELACVHTSAPYSFLRTGLYQNDSFYTEGGMSGGPVYLNENGGLLIAAVNVGGTSPPDPAQSVARAITTDERPLLLDAEYVHGEITGAVLAGPATVAAGATATYKAGLIFVDGATEGAGIPHRYTELTLVAQGSSKHELTVTQFKPERFQVAFARSLPSGSQVVLRLLRDTEKPKGQTPLQTLTVTIQ